MNTPSNKLRKIRLEFDIYLPETYTTDTLLEVLAQILTSVNDSTQISQGINPSVSIRTQDDKFKVHVWGQSEQNTTRHEYDEVVELADVQREKWIHFDIYIKEGYMPEHDPLTVIKIDNKVVYRSIIPNAHNSAAFGIVKYGIYKSPWYAGETGLVNQRDVYFDNVVLTI